MVNFSKLFDYKNVFWRDGLSVYKPDKIPQPLDCNAYRLLHSQDLGFFPFARRYLGNTRLRRVSFPQVTEMFQFTWCRLPPINREDILILIRMGFPIRIPPDQSLFATPRGLSQLTASFIACWYQGIHHIPLVAWPHYNITIISYSAYLYKLYVVVKEQ